MLKTVVTIYKENSIEDIAVGLGSWFGVIFLGILVMLFLGYVSKRKQVTHN